MITDIVEKDLKIKMTPEAKTLFMYMWRNTISKIDTFKRPFSKTTAIHIYANFMAKSIPDLRVGIFSIPWRIAKMGFTAGIFSKDPNTVCLSDGCRKTFDNGSTINSHSLEPPGVCGCRYDIVIIDEAQYISPDIIKTVAVPLLNIKKLIEPELHLIYSRDDD